MKAKWKCRKRRRYDQTHRCLLCLCFLLCARLDPKIWMVRSKTVAACLKLNSRWFFTLLHSVQRRATVSMLMPRWVCGDAKIRSAVARLRTGIAVVLCFFFYRAYFSIVWFCRRAVRATQIRFSSQGLEWPGTRCVAVADLSCCEFRLFGLYCWMWLCGASHGKYTSLHNWIMNVPLLLEVSMFGRTRSQCFARPNRVCFHRLFSVFVVDFECATVCLPSADASSMWRHSNNDNNNNNN